MRRYEKHAENWKIFSFSNQEKPFSQSVRPTSAEKSRTDSSFLTETSGEDSLRTTGTPNAANLRRKPAAKIFRKTTGAQDARPDGGEFP